jgi:hypothetical protein
LEFIAGITQQIQDRLMQITRYFGWDSNRMRGDRNKAEAAEGVLEESELKKSEVIITISFKSKKIPQLMWRECITEVDPFLCPHCRSLMRLIIFICERIIIKKILNHLGLFKEDKPKQNKAPPVSRDFIERIIELYDEGWPDYEEPFVNVQTL